MTMLSGLCAAVAVILALTPRAKVRQRLLDVPELRGSHSARPDRPVGTILGRLGLAAGVCLPLVVWLLLGPRAAVLAATALVMIGVVLRLIAVQVADRRALQARRAVAEACSVLASQVRVGRVPSEALRVAAQDCAVLAEADQVQRMGGDVTVVWRVGAGWPGQGGLLQLARAWHICAQTGAPLASALERVAEALATEEGLRAVVAGELSAPRATGKIMAVLPFCGLGLGFLIGGDPLGFLLSGPYGWGCLIGGACLAGAGVLWIDRLAHAAAQQG
jgi:tight adherence protein B